MLTVANGFGVNSIAMLIGMKRRGMRPDRIMFADVGSEKDETYAYGEILAPWLEAAGFPRVTIVKYVPKNFKNWPPYYTLEENCLTNGSDVLLCLVSDASGYDNAGDFAEWASEYGYDQDSRKAERIYRAVKKQAEQLKRTVGDKVYEALKECSE